MFFAKENLYFGIALVKNSTKASLLVFQIKVCTQIVQT